MEIKKVGVKLPFTFESILQSEPEALKGRYRKLTPQERAEWEDARAALKLLENNPWVGWDRDDGYFLREPRKWVTEVVKTVPKVVES